MTSPGFGRDKIFLIFVSTASLICLGEDW